MLNTIGLVAVGGAIGAVARYSMVLWATRMFGAGFPVGTMLVNIMGSFVMGMVAVVFLHKAHHPVITPLVMTGILGGFTTFSAFSLDALALFEKGKIASAGFYVFGSVGLSIIALFLGLICARSIWA